MSRPRNKKDDKQSSKGSKRPSKNTRYGSGNRDDAHLDNRGRDNDPNYYFTNAEVAEQASQLSFQSVIGLNSLNGYKMPSICRVFMNPSPGVTYKPQSVSTGGGYSEWAYATALDDSKHGINLMASKLYTMLSTFTGRTSQYAPQDVGMMILAISSIAEYSEFIRRCFGVALTYNPRNRNMPLGILKTMGIDVPDFMANIPAYRMKFNVLMTRINQIPLLDNIAYIRKSREIYQRLYVDSPSSMAQIFYYAPGSVWTLNETIDSDGSVLLTTPVCQNLNGTPITDRKMSIHLKNLEAMITAVLESSTLNLIYADLLNMANKIKVPVWQFDYLAENYIVMPEFNRNALLQFHHMRVMGNPYEIDNPTTGDHICKVTRKWHTDQNTSSTSVTTYTSTVTSNNDVVCDPNANNVIYCPAFPDSTYLRAIVDMDNSNPTMEDRIESLRYCVINSKAKVQLRDIDTEYPTAVNMLFDLYPTLPDHYVTKMTFFTNVDYTVGAQNNPVSVDANVATSFSNDILATIEKFERHPLLYQVNTSDYRSCSKLYGDVDFYTEVDYNYLERLNELMYTGLFDFRT